jgi:molybdopterin molybdotransferase
VPAFEDRPADWLSLGEARARMLSRASPGEPGMVEVPEALGLALAEPVVSPLTLPARASSAMDGYALRAADIAGASSATPVHLRVTGVLRPGALPGRGPQAGEAIRILTGGPIPPGADTVVRVEHTDGEAGGAGLVRILQDSDAGRNVRPAGEDVNVGETVLLPGSAVEPGTIALLAGLGLTPLPVHPRPRVSILSTGDELVPAFGRASGPGPASPVRDANGPALFAAVRQAGGDPRPPVLVPDDPDALRNALREGSRESDLMLVTGGASMGEADLVKRVLDTMDFRLDFWRVRIRPGSPFGFGFLPRPGGPPLPIAGLPGNPASALVTFEILVRPLLRTLGGHARIHRMLVDARAAETLPGLPDLTHLVRVTLERVGRGWEARPAGPQRSNLLAPLARAHGIAEVPPGGSLEPGSAVTVHLLTADTDAGFDMGYVG